MTSVLRWLTRPLINCACLLAAGILLGTVADNGPPFFIGHVLPPYVILTCVLLAGLWSWLAYRRRHGFHAIVFLSLAVVGIGVGFAQHALHQRLGATHIARWLAPRGERLLCEGLLAARPRISGQGVVAREVETASGGGRTHRAHVNQGAEGASELAGAEPPMEGARASVNPAHSAGEGEAPRAWPVEGATRAPVIERTQLRIDLTHCRNNEQMTPASGRVRLSSVAPLPDLHRGDRVRFFAQLHPPRSYRNPGGAVAYWRQQAEGIAAVGLLAEPGWILRIAAAEQRTVRRTIDRWAARVEDRLQTIAQGDALGILVATITGNGRFLSPEGWDRFRRIGAIHLLVVSGFHVACVALCAWVFFTWCTRRSLRLLLIAPAGKFAAPFSIAVVWVYTLFVGAEPPVVRAALMTTVVLAALLSDRRRDIASALALAALCLLAWSPLLLFLPSFQLTFAAVIGICCWRPWLARQVGRWSLPTDRWWWRLVKGGGEIVGISLAAFLGVAPLLAYHFHTVSLMGLLTDGLLVPLIGFVLTPLGLVFAALVPWWATGAGWIGVPLRCVAEWVAALVETADRMSAPFQIGVSPYGYEVALWYLLSALALDSHGRSAWRRAVAAAALGLALVSIGGRMEPFLGTRDLTITFFDVGQGNSAVIRFPNGKTMVVDGGGIARSAFDIGRWVVAPALHRMQIRRVDDLVLTHHHPDHYGGVAAVAEVFHPRRLWTNGAAPDADDPLWPTIAARLQATGIRTIAVNAGAPAWHEGEVTIRVMHPGADGPEPVYGQNNNSIVQFIEYGDVRILLTGDIEREAEAVLVQSGRLTPVDILQVPHHGSATSSTPAFLDAVRPTVAVISCGRQNRYGFPSPGVLARYAQLGTQVYRTDLHGAVTIRTDGKRIAVATYERVTK